METVPFEPMTVAQMFRTALTLYRRRFWHFVGLVAVVQVPLALLSAGADLPEAPGTTAYLNVIGQSLIMIAASAICTGALARSITELRLGTSLTVGQAYGSLGSQALTLAAAGVLAALGIVAGLFIFILPGIIIAIYCAVAVPCVAMENIGPMAALDRSRTLVRYDMAKVFWLGLILLAASFAIGYPIGRAIQLSVAAFLGPGTPLTRFVSSLLGGLIALWLWPIYVIPQILLYFHLRSCEDEGPLPGPMQLRS